MRRTLTLVLLLTALPLVAQSIRLGPEHVVQPATVDSARGDLRALLPHGDALVAFRSGEPLHATLLDRKGNVLSETIIPDPGAREPRIAVAGDGYLVVDKGFATSLEFDFHVRGARVDLPVDTQPVSIACGAAECAVVWRDVATFRDSGVMLLGLDGTPLTNPIPLPRNGFARVAAIGSGFLASYTDLNHGLHSAFIDARGVMTNVHDYVIDGFAASPPAATPIGDGGIVIWPDGNDLFAAHIDANGVAAEARRIATFTYSDFEDLSVSCSGTECTAGVAWYDKGPSFVAGPLVGPPKALIRAVRFTTLLQPIDAAPVSIADSDENVVVADGVRTDVQAAATPDGTVLGWSAFRGTSARVAFLARGAAPYSGDTNVDGRPIASGPASVDVIAATRDAIAWNDHGWDGVGNVRVAAIDDDGVASDPQTLVHDDGAFRPIVVGTVVVWQHTRCSAVVARPGRPERTTLDGGIAGPMISDGTESVLVLHTGDFCDQTSDSTTLARFGATGPPSIVNLDFGRFELQGGWVADGKLFLEFFQGTGVMEARAIDLDKGTSASIPSVGGVYGGQFVVGDRFVTAVSIWGDASGKFYLGVRLLARNGQSIDAQPLKIDAIAGAVFFATPLGRRVLIAWEAEDGLKAAVFDPETHALTPPSPFGKDEDRQLVGLLARDDRHAIAVFRKHITVGDDDAWAVSTQRLEVASDVHHRAAAR